MRLRQSELDWNQVEVEGGSTFREEIASGVSLMIGGLDWRKEQE